MFEDRHRERKRRLWSWVNLVQIQVCYHKALGKMVISARLTFCSYYIWQRILVTYPNILPPSSRASIEV